MKIAQNHYAQKVKFNIYILPQNNRFQIEKKIEYKMIQISYDEKVN